MEPDQQLRNLRDFLLVYNRMTEICFQRCSSNFNYRSLTMDEERCADSCAGKLIRSNHRLMGTYVQLMPKMVQRRMEEMESKAAEAAKVAGAAAAGEGAGVAALTEGSSLAEAPLPSAPAEVPPMISSALSGTADSPPGLSADVSVVPSPGPVLADATGAAGLEFLVDLVPAASVAIAASPGPEGNIPSSLPKAVNEAAFTTVPLLQSPLITCETSTTSVGVAAGAPPISAPIVPGNMVPVTSVPPTFTPAAPVTPAQVASMSSIAPPAVPQAPAASTVPLMSAQVVTPSVGLPEGARPPSAPGLVPPVENPDRPACSDMSFSPSLAPSTVTKQDSQPPC